MFLALSSHPHRRMTRVPKIILFFALHFWSAHNTATHITYVQVEVQESVPAIIPPNVRIVLVFIYERDIYIMHLQIIDRFVSYQ